MSDLEALAAFAILAFLGVSYVIIVWLVRSGRELARELELRHPDAYAAAGKPLPGYFESARRTRWAQFVARREYAEFAEPPLVERIDAYRGLEARSVIGLIAGLIVIGLFAAYSRYGAS